MNTPNMQNRTSMTAEEIAEELKKLEAEEMAEQAALAASMRTDDLPEQIASAVNYRLEEWQPKHQPASALTKLAKRYLVSGIDNQVKPVPLNLTPAFRARRETYRHLISQARKAGKTEPEALTLAVNALCVADDKLGALILLQQVNDNALFWCSVDVILARRSREKENAGDYDSSERMSDQGLGDHEQDPGDSIQGVSPDATERPSEEDAVHAMIEVNGWLGNVADLLPENDAEREFLRLEQGLRYCDKPPQVPGGLWDPVHEPWEAVEVQIIKNEASAQRRRVRDSEKRAKAYEALTSLIK